MSVQVFVGERGSGLAMNGAAPVWIDTTTVDEGLAWVAEQVAQVGAGRWRRPRASVWLAGSLARPFLLQPIPGVKGHDEARRIAEKVGAEATGLSGPCEAWLESGSADATRIATVMKASVRDTVAQVLGTALKVAHIRPWWAGVLNAVVRTAPGSVALGVDDGESVTLLGGRAQGFELARSFGAVDASQGPALLSRAVLGSADLSGSAVWVSIARPGSALEGAAPLEVAFGGRWSRVE